MINIKHYNFVRRLYRKILMNLYFVVRITKRDFNLDRHILWMSMIKKGYITLSSIVFVGWKIFFQCVIPNNLIKHLKKGSFIFLFFFIFLHFHLWDIIFWDGGSDVSETRICLIEYLWFSMREKTGYYFSIEILINLVMSSEDIK